MLEVYIVLFSFVQSCPGTEMLTNRGTSDASNKFIYEDKLLVRTPLFDMAKKKSDNIRSKNLAR
jgi:hypothetical protein